MIAIDLSKLQAPDSKVMQQISFTANLDQVGDTIMFFTIEEAKEAILGFSQGTARVS